MKTINILFLVFIAILSGCSTAPVVSTRYSPEQESIATSFAVSKDVARIYFSAGRVVGGMYEVDLKNHPSGLYVNSILIGQINFGETLVFDLKPGSYSFTNSHGANQGVNQTNITISGGELVFLRGDTRLGSGTGFGLIGAAVSKATGERTGLEVNRIDRTAIPQPLNVVSPQNCPPTICISGLSLSQAPITRNSSPNSTSSASPLTQNSQGNTPTQRLKELNELRKNGLITNADYEAKKASILKEM
jgi:hypothetical protein